MDNLETIRRECESFVRDGFIGPITVFTRAQCELTMCHFRRGNSPTPFKLGKGQAASDRLIFGLATRPALLARLRLLLGNDILLWGASLITREPNEIHPWHCDIESSALSGGFVSVWIGIENTRRESALHLITRSHAIGKTIQQVAHENGIVPTPEPITPALASQFHPLKLPLPEDRVKRWRPHHLFAGVTTNVLHMSAHVSVLSPGHSPHPPHAHSEEEILVVLDGEAEIVIAQNETGLGARYEQLSAASFAYYPAFQFHTIRNTTATPITYLMFKWTGLPRETESPLETTISRTKNIRQIGDASLTTQLAFEGPTHYLPKLPVHLTELQSV